MGASRSQGTAVSTSQEQALAERVARSLSQRLLAWRPITQGYTTAVCLIVTCADRRSVFVKGATDARTAEWLRREHAIYSHVRAPFLAAMHVWEDDGSKPFLVLEDLSKAVWRAPWTARRIMQVLDTLRQVAATSPPAGLESLEERRSHLAGWAKVRQDPGPFLRLRVCTADWLARTLDALVRAEAGVRLTGNGLVHCDVRSDNLCFINNRVVFVDWTWACRGNGDFDVAAWLPSLYLEGGPLPDTMLSEQPHFAALVSGYFAARAGLPVEQSASKRALQQAQLRAALPWAVRALGLPPFEYAERSAGAAGT